MGTDKNCKDKPADNLETSAVHVRAQTRGVAQSLLTHAGSK